MAKGAHGGKRGAAYGSLKSGELIVSGKPVLFDGELKYGPDDQNITPIARAKLDEFAVKRRDAKLEFLTAVDENGEFMGPEIKGQKDKVKHPRSYMGEGVTSIHNHPVSDGLSGTFSYGDMKTFTDYSDTSARVVGREGTYSITKSKSFDSKGFMDYIYDGFAKIEQAQNAKRIAMRSKSKDEFVDYIKKAANNERIAVHNMYLEGQKRFGYTYTLEKPKK